MTDLDYLSLIAFLKKFKQDLMEVAGILKAKVLKRKDLDNVFSYATATEEQQKVVQDMVEEAKISDGITTGQGKPDTYQADADGNEISGPAKTLASSHFKNSEESPK
jgi:Asp/Glu/hydantoin racemase